VPKRKTHEVISKLLLGQTFSEVNQAIDWPIRFLGPSHRIMFHTIPEAFIIGLVVTGDVKGAIAGVAHVLTDNVSSSTMMELKKLTKKGGELECRKKRKQKRRKKNYSF
jgi:hypothetical protein